MFRPIAINAVLNGFIVTVGCQTVVFNSADVLLQELAGYLANPEVKEKQYAMLTNARHVSASEVPQAIGDASPTPIRRGTNEVYAQPTQNEASSDPRGGLGRLR